MVLENSDRNHKWIQNEFKMNFEHKFVWQMVKTGTSVVSKRISKDQRRRKHCLISFLVNHLSILEKKLLVTCSISKGQHPIASWRTQTSLTWSFQMVWDFYLCACCSCSPLSSCPDLHSADYMYKPKLKLNFLLWVKVFCSPINTQMCFCLQSILAEILKVSAQFSNVGSAVMNNRWLFRF